MRRKLFEVEDCLYTVSGRLWIAARTEKEFLDFKEGDFVILIRPDGTEIETQINGTGRFKVLKSYVEAILFDRLKREEAPIGTVVMLKI